MSETALLTPAAAPARAGLPVLAGGIALSSCAALLLELALTRLFSVVLFYHFAFLAISIALLGLGGGGVFAHLAKRWLSGLETCRLLAWLALTNALAVPLVLEIVLHDPVSLELSRANLLGLTCMYLASAVPFFLTGFEFSVVFARESAHIPRLYGADLSGGALACLMVVPLLNWLGGPNTVISAGVLTACAALVWAPRRGMRRLCASIVFMLLLLLAGNRHGRLADVVYAKGKFRDPSWVEFARWNAISRVEVDRQGPAKTIVIDADASTYIMNVDPRNWHGTVWERNLMSAPPALANVLRLRGDYAIIGPGGGVDVLRALASGSPSVTAIEINSIIANTIMRGRYADYSYQLYRRPEVHVEVRDGRSFIRTSRDNYDVVQMTLVDTWASTAAGAFALSENNLYTVEAFTEYFEHLKPDGLVAITRWEFHQPREALRIVSVALEALHRLGTANPARDFIVVSEGDLDEDGIPVAVLVKKSAFTPEEESAVQAHLAKYPALVALHLPSHPEANPFSALIQSNDPYAFARTYPYNIRPVNDNAPFFFFTIKLAQLLREESLQQGIDWKVNLGVAVLAMVFVVSLVAVLAFLVVPLIVAGGSRRAHAMPLLYFIAVGLGYILVEIAFIQRFVLFLGHPTYALTVVVFLLLLSSGGGSLLSRKWLGARRSLWLPLVAILLMLTLELLVLPVALSRLVGLAFAAKLLLSGLLLVPLGFVMGMPFPSGLRVLATIQGAENDIEWAWAMNAAASVLGSVLAVIISIELGLNITLASAAVAYASALLLTGTLRVRPA